jgi:N-acetylglutamate synthase-like GNAT family acetyltransferase
LRCGDLGRIVTLHGEAYQPLPGFGLKFEAYVAKTIAEYVLDNSARGRVWLAERDGRLVGCTAIALRPGRAGQLRWVLVEHSARGTGLGRRLVETAIAFGVESGCDRLYLETTDGLPESQALYEKLGFEVVSSEPQVLWEDERPLVRMEKRLT